MKNTGQRPYWGRSVDSIPRSFTLTQAQVNYLLQRKRADAISCSELIRDLIDAEMARTGFRRGDANGDS